MDVYHLRADRFEETDSLSVDNRGFLYADGFFESILCVDGLPTFWKYRSARIEQTMRFLRLRTDTSVDRLKAALETVLESYACNHQRCRLTFFREPGGRYLPQGNRMEVLLQVEALDSDPFANVDQRTAGLSSITLPITRSGNHKLIAKHWQVLAALEGEEEGKEDMVVLNDKGEVAETIAGNVFAVIRNAVVTPSLDSCCLDGVARRALLELEHVHEGRLKLDHLRAADALFTVNSVSGVSALNFREINTKPEHVQVFQEELIKRRGVVGA